MLAASSSLKALVMEILAMGCTVQVLAWQSGGVGLSMAQVRDVVAQLWACAPEPKLQHLDT